jgi:hypothetical protein
MYRVVEKRPEASAFSAFSAAIKPAREPQQSSATRTPFIKKGTALRDAFLVAMS